MEQIDKNNLRNILALCNSAYKEMRNIKKDSQTIDPFDLHYRIDWAMTRIEYAIEHLDVEGV